MEVTLFSHLLTDNYVKKHSEKKRESV